MLEFRAKLGDESLKGIDLIQVDTDGLIVDFVKYPYGPGLLHSCSPEQSLPTAESRPRRACLGGA